MDAERGDAVTNAGETVTAPLAEDAPRAVATGALGDGAFAAIDVATWLEPASLTASTGPEVKSSRGIAAPASSPKAAATSSAITRVRVPSWRAVSPSVEAPPGAALVPELGAGDVVRASSCGSADVEAGDPGQVRVFACACDASARLGCTTLAMRKLSSSATMRRAIHSHSASISEVRAD